MKQGAAKGEVKRRRRTGYYDYNLLAAVIILICFGLVMLYSASAYEASNKFGNDMYYFGRQAVISLASVGAALAISKIDYHILSKWALHLYVLALILMAMVRFSPLGVTAGGARRWLNLGIQFQPSEIAKIAVILFLPAVILKMGRQASRRKAVLGLFASAAFCSFFTGVTEPLEFSFMFLAPGLYVLYAAMCGITAAITVMLPIRAGFSFSAGFLDLFFSSQTPLAQNPWMVCVVGIIAAVVFYTVFRIVIVKFDLKTPGREDEEAAPKTTLKGDAAFVAYAEKVLEGLGGKDNIAVCDNCITRIRCEIKDRSKVNDDIIKSAGARGVLHPSDTSVQIIVGTQVQFVVDELKKML